RQGKNPSQQEFLRMFLLDKFSILSREYLDRPTTHAATRDLYQICYLFSSFLLLKKSTLINESGMSDIIPLSQFPGAAQFFSAVKIDPKTLSEKPGPLVFNWFNNLGLSGWRYLRPCLIAFGTLLATFIEDFQCVSVPSCGLSKYNSTAFITPSTTTEEAEAAGEEKSGDDEITAEEM
ncbi:hypothetical protein MBANPS3_007510, partial [Mucor bainieri]